MIENFVFGKSGLNSRVFEKLFISYSCILFIKYYALRSFCIEMLCFFSKNLIFSDFQSIEPVAQPIEIAIKNLVWICLTRLMLDRSNVIFDRSNLIFDHSKIVQRVFLKHKFFMCSSLFQTFSKTFWLSLSSTGPSQAEFCCFPSNFFKGFCLLAPVRPFYPSFFCLF